MQEVQSVVCASAGQSRPLGPGPADPLRRRPVRLGGTASPRQPRPPDQDGAVLLEHPVARPPAAGQRPLPLVSGWPLLHPRELAVRVRLPVAVPPVERRGGKDHQCRSGGEGEGVRRRRTLRPALAAPLGPGPAGTDLGPRPEAGGAGDQADRTERRAEETSQGKEGPTTPQEVSDTNCRRGDRKCRPQRVVVGFTAEHEVRGETPPRRSQRAIDRLR